MAQENQKRVPFIEYGASQETLPPVESGQVLSTQTLSLVAKRFIDILGAVMGLVALAPLLLIIACILKLTDRGPIFFRQVRVGRGGQRFSCLKFRTMIVNADQVLQEHLKNDMAARREWEHSQKLRDDPRITWLGRFLRRTSLDELPQLVNIIVGEMSLVGPRPIIPAEMSRYGHRLDYYLSMRPGLTGLWQVSGRNDCSYNERVELDARYVREWRLFQDFAILIRTIPAVIKQRGSC
ncbi:sugar transferase [Microvirga aerophila]|uniref:sugar transferase n=1 Tax=Microvirga aerophila TaxID=670291 RepID=UPI000DEF56EA|nr:sugar transferase [Microvirga aerophila]